MGYPIKTSLCSFGQPFIQRFGISMNPKSEKKPFLLRKGCACLLLLIPGLCVTWIGLGWCCDLEIAEFIVRLGARQVCSDIADSGETYVQSHLLQNPSGAYRIYAITPPSYPTKIYFCDPEGNPLKALIKDETAEIKFSPDYRILAIYEVRFGNIALFDADTLEEITTINVRDGIAYVLIRAVAFHPTEPILAFTREPRGGTSELYLWNIETDELIDKIAVGEIYDNSLTFNADGTLLYFTDDSGGHIWGIPAAE
jgi:WD40 repeat protein